MKTFFLNESTESTVAPVLLTEAEIVEGTLLYENAAWQSEVEYQAIVQEAMLAEASILTEAEAISAGDKKSLKDRAKAMGANVGEFFKKMLKWFQDRLVEIKDFVANQLNSVTKRIAGLVVAANKKADKTKKVNVTYAYGKLNSGIIDSFALAAVKAIATGEDKVDELESAKLSPKSARRTFEITVAEGISILSRLESGIGKVRQVQKAVAQKANEGIKSARAGIKAVEGKDEAAKAAVAKHKEEIAKAQKAIRTANKASAHAVRMFNSAAGAYARAIIGPAVKEEKAAK